MLAWLPTRSWRVSDSSATAAAPIAPGKMCPSVTWPTPIFEVVTDASPSWLVPTAPLAEPATPDRVLRQRGGGVRRPTQRQDQSIG